MSNECIRAEALRKFQPRVPEEFKQMVNAAIEDEQKAVGEYNGMADYADRLGKHDMATVFRGIAGDEQRHHDELLKIYNRLQEGG